MRTQNTQHNKSIAAVYGLMLVIIIFIGKVPELVPGLDKFSLGKIAISLTILFAFNTHVSDKAWRLSSAPAKCIFGILAIAIVSIPFGLWPGGSFDFIVFGYSKMIIFFLLMLIIVNTVADLEKIVWAVAFSGFFLSVAAMLVDTDEKLRVSISHTYDTNDLCFILVCLLPIIFYFAKSRNPLVKVTLFALMGLMLLASLRTGSRGGLLGLVAVGIAILLKQKFSLKQTVLPIVAAVTIMMVFAPQSYWERMSTIFNPKDDYNTTDSSGRIEIWKRGLNIMVSNPILGIGANCFGTAEGAQHEGGKWSAAHNSFVQIGAELGIIALTLFITAIFKSIKNLKQCRALAASSQFPTWLPDGIEVSFYGYVTSGFFLSQAYSPVLLFIVALAIIVTDMVRGHDGDDGKKWGGASSRARPHVPGKLPVNV